jgi:hypothetical protein
MQRPRSGCCHQPHGQIGCQPIDLVPGAVITLSTASYRAGYAPLESHAMNTELFCDITRFPGYSISPTGQVLSAARVIMRRNGSPYPIRRSRLLREQIDTHSGLPYVVLSRDHRPHYVYIHKLVAEVFGRQHAPR